jgi:hypothetical protein
MKTQNWIDIEKTPSPVNVKVKALHYTGKEYTVAFNGIHCSMMTKKGPMLTLTRNFTAYRLIEN